MSPAWCRSERVVTDRDIPVAPAQPNPYQPYGPDEAEEVEEDPYNNYGQHHSYYQPNYPEPRLIEPEETIIVADGEEELRSPGIQRLTRNAVEREPETKTRTSAHF